MSDLLVQKNQPLFPRILWDKPVNKKAAKRLLIIGGQRSRFKAPELAYLSAKKAGIGEVKVALPDSLKNSLGEHPDFLYVPSTRAGSIDKSASETLSNFAQGVNGVLLAGDLSKNADTISSLENLLTRTSRPIFITSEVIETFLFNPQLIVSKPTSLLISNTRTLTKLAGKLGVAIQISAQTSLLNKVDLLTQLNSAYTLDLVLWNREVIVCSKGKVSVTDISTGSEAELSGYLSTFWLQHPQKFQALSAAVYELGQN